MQQLCIEKDTIYLTSNTILYILTSQNIPNSKEVTKVFRKKSEINFLNRLVTFINNNPLNYVIDNLDKFMSIFNPALTKEVYLSLLYYYFNFYNTTSEELSKKCKMLYLHYDIDSLYHPKSYESHFKTHYLTINNVENDVSLELENYIERMIPESITDPLELSIAIYLLLCQTLKYDALYTLFRNNNQTSLFSNVTISNNDVVCYTFSIIYYKLLQKYGINCTLCGSEDLHMTVAIQIGNMRLTADGTRFGTINNETNRVSDLTAVKYGLPITGFYLETKDYKDNSWLAFYQTRLSFAINMVYKKLGLICNADKKYENILKHFSEANKGTHPTAKKEIGRLNTFMQSFKDFGTVEHAQIFKRYQEFILHNDIRHYYSIITLYSLSSKVQISHLIVVEGENLYFLEINGTYRSLTKEELLIYINNHSLIFKDLNDLDSLYIPEKLIAEICQSQEKLIKEYNQVTLKKA